MRYAIILACMIQLLEGIRGYQMFQGSIPNGEIVPHPCKANYIWRGVGHKNALGGGERNPFGLAFYTSGKQWTKALCQLDSDGDGKTNGEELGDPNCVWSPGHSPFKSVGLTHPGVCEPVNSSQCAGKNDWVDCHVDEFKCDAINNNVVKSRYCVVMLRRFRERSHDSYPMGRKPTVVFACGYQDDLACIQHNSYKTLKALNRCHKLGRHNSVSLKDSGSRDMNHNVPTNILSRSLFVIHITCASPDMDTHVTSL
ncbi:hypothetical protein CHS0354_007713 [Potamilus streckersoni]|uniref:Temptin Cys/Cys disulfide domain-containing protein n=1 Tax=Potamilus streckersoni TaxID=2493646 RepID=A0AAE0SEP0_9BIVA|nr:hypothetical protein CHS0354_007713 [Potamilus streckersoni]